MRTYNQIIDILRSFSTDHKQLKSFYSGTEWDFNAEASNSIYATMVVIPNETTFNGSSLVHNFKIYFLDILNADKSNLDEIYSDTQRIAIDLLSLSNDNFTNLGYFVDIPSCSMIPVEEVFDDILAGWELTYIIQQPYDMEVCGLPSDWSIPSFAYGGAQGPRGFQGFQGPQGSAGTTGQDGQAGPQGLQGLQGPQGIAGTTGQDGQSGLTGPQGPPGPSSSSNIRKFAIDSVNTLICYCGYAPVGSAEDSAVWTITKIVTTIIGDVDNSTTVTNWKWTEREII